MRKPSAQTENRRLRRELRQALAALEPIKAELFQRRSCGGAMGNILYNIAGRSGGAGVFATEHEVEVMRRCRRDWDDIKRAV